MKFAAKSADRRLNMLLLGQNSLFVWEEVWCVCQYSPPQVATGGAICKEKVWL